MALHDEVIKLAHTQPKLRQHLVPLLRKFASEGQLIVFRGLRYSGAKDLKSVNDYFEKQGWGTCKFVMKFKTLPGRGGAGGRSDVVMELTGNIMKFATGRFALENPPS
jgi:hypothetical protein